MTPSQLRELSDVQLLDVRLADDYAASHLEGAVNNCVFEVAFADRLTETVPDPSARTVVYGANGESREAAMAAEKLDRAGFTDVEVLEGGLEAASRESLPLVTGEPVPPTPRIVDGGHPVDVDESRVEWTGRNLLNRHWGTAPIRSGTLVFRDGMIASGEIRIDLRGIACTDLADSDLHDVLIEHLHSDDFFDVENHPEAVLRLLSARKIEGAAEGAPNLRLDGELSLRGETHPIALEAVAGVTPEGKAAAQASFLIDRTTWGILYGSGKFFHRLAGHLVHDLIDFDVKIVTR